MIARSFTSSAAISLAFSPVWTYWELTYPVTPPEEILYHPSSEVSNTSQAPPLGSSPMTSPKLSGVFRMFKYPETSAIPRFA